MYEYGYVTYPVVSMDNQPISRSFDSLFLGIEDPAADLKLEGTKDQPHLHMRFNTLDKQEATTGATVRYIVHPGNLRSLSQIYCVSFFQGTLIRATFDMKVFVEQICQLIYESNAPRARFTKMYSILPGRVFQDFNLYFGR